MIFSKIKDMKKIINRITKKILQAKIEDKHVWQNGLWSEKVKCMDTFVNALLPDTG